MRVHELAKKLNISSKDLISKLKELKIEAKSHMSVIDDDTAEIVLHEVKGSVVEEKAKKQKEKEGLLKEIWVNFPITVKDLSVKIQIKPSDLIKRLMKMSTFATINQSLDNEAAKKAAAGFGFNLKEAPTLEDELLNLNRKVDKNNLVHRPPIVTFMGHVDHGKTSLLDYIRNSKVVSKEAGGITQHIGAYEAILEKGCITFLDTPGHEAFTTMRARGANITDIVVLVVAADDGIMPQTREALDHARTAGVPVIVAVNKIDKPNVNIDKTKKQLAELDLLPEDWGGKTIVAGVSAKTGEGVDHLLDMILLEAEILELKAEPNIPAQGAVVEAAISKGRGAVATVLVKNGTLRVGDLVFAGHYYGKVKAMINDKGQWVKEAGPSVPVEILGLSGIPEAGGLFYVVEDERKARQLSITKLAKMKANLIKPKVHITLEELYTQIKEGKVKEVKLIVKADVQGSAEALCESLVKLTTKEVKLNIIHSEIGLINTSDVMLASASNAIIIGFHIGKDPTADALSKKEDVDIRLYDIIYEVMSDIKAAMEGLLEPHIKQVMTGRAEIRQIFKMSKAGNVAGCIVTKGRIGRTNMARLIRGGERVYEGKISCLKRFKDDVKEVQDGFECGIALSNFSNIREGDIIESYIEEKVARRLEETR